MELTKKFWDKVDIKGDNNCWIWKGAKQKQGYGRFKINRKLFGTHRLVVGEKNIPKGLLVCHKCDNPPCVNPKHLFIGTGSDNMKDASNKGRLHCGGHNKKFNHKDIAKIKILKNEGLSNRKIAKRFNVWHSTINDIINNKYYKGYFNSSI